MALPVAFTDSSSSSTTARAGDSSVPHDMPAFRDQDDPEIVWVWDAEAHDYAPKRLNNRPLRGWSSGGDNELFDPAVHRFKPKNPTQEGFLAGWNPFPGEEAQGFDNPQRPSDPRDPACPECGGALISSVQSDSPAAPPGGRAAHRARAAAARRRKRSR